MARVTKTITMVQCAKIGLELEALARPPFPGPLGERIYNEISKEGYALWQQRASMVINHYGLNLADPNAHEMLFQQMEEFLFGEGQGGAIAGAPVGKGAPRK
jgi:Fe-S cluster biosynthesis and repair protein YggX